VLPAVPRRDRTQRRVRHVRALPWAPHLAAPPAAGAGGRQRERRCNRAKNKPAVQNTRERARRADKSEYYKYTHARGVTHTRARARTHTPHTRAHLRAHTHTHTHTHTHAHTQTDKHTHRHTGQRTDTHMHTHAPAHRPSEQGARAAGKYAARIISAPKAAKPHAWATRGGMRCTRLPQRAVRLHGDPARLRTSRCCGKARRRNVLGLVAVGVLLWRRRISAR
jgi:hypothetical protein